MVYVAFAALGLLVSFGISQNVLSKEHETTKTGLAEEEKNRMEAMKKRKESKELARRSKELGREPKEEV